MGSQPGAPRGSVPPPGDCDSAIGPPMNRSIDGMRFFDSVFHGAKAAM